ISDLSWLNPTPHAIAVYASQPLSPVATQHSLPSGRYSLLGPDFHRLDRTSFAWRTHSITSSARASRLSGTVRPSAFAVLRLVASSYLVGACTGRSARGIARGNAIARRERRKLDAPAREEHVTSDVQASAPSRTRVAKAASISRLVLALRT